MKPDSAAVGKLPTAALILKTSLTMSEMTARTHPTLLIFLSFAAVVALTAWSAFNPAARPRMSVPPPAGPADVDVHTLMEIISQTKSVSETDRQISEAQTVTRLHPSRAGSWVRLGDLLAQKQRDVNLPVWYDHAELAYQKAFQIEPRNADALNGLAWVYGGRHDFQESVRWAKLALEAEPTNPISHGIIGDAALELGDTERAFESYQAMLDLRPDMSAYSRAGYLVWLTGDGRKARWLMQKAIDSGSPHAENTAWCRTRLALMLFHEGALLAATQITEEGLKAAPDHLPLLLMLGKIHLAQNNEKAALAAFEKVLTQEENHDALASLLNLHQVHGRMAEAEACFQRIEKLHEQNVARGTHDHTQMARFYADHDRRLDQALKYAEEHAQSQNIYEADTLAWVCYRKGDLKRARKAIEIALKAGTPDAEIFYHAGLISAALNDKPGAQKLLSRALSLNPHFHPLHAKKAVKMLDEMGQPLAAKD